MALLFYCLIFFERNFCTKLQKESLHLLNNCQKTVPLLKPCFSFIRLWIFFKINTTTFRMVAFFVWNFQQEADIIHQRLIVTKSTFQFFVYQHCRSLNKVSKVQLLHQNAADSKVSKFWPIIVCIIFINSWLLDQSLISSLSFVPTWHCLLKRCFEWRTDAPGVEYETKLGNISGLRLFPIRFEDFWTDHLLCPQALAALFNSPVTCSIYLLKPTILP